MSVPSCFCQVGQVGCTARRCACRGEHETVNDTCDGVSSFVGGACHSDGCSLLWRALVTPSLQLPEILCALSGRGAMR